MMLVAVGALWWCLDMGTGMGTGKVYRGTGRESSWKILPLTENSDIPRVCTVKSVKQGRDCLLVIMLRVRKQSLLSLCHLSTSHTYTSAMAPAVKAKKVSWPGVPCVQS